MAQVLTHYGKLLITARPEDTTRLLMDLCIPAQTASSNADTSYVASVADFAHLYTERPTALMLLCEFILNSQEEPPSEQLLYHTLLELYLADHLADEPAEFHSDETAAGQPTPQQQSQQELLPQVNYCISNVAHLVRTDYELSNVNEQVQALSGIGGAVQHAWLSCLRCLGLNCHANRLLEHSLFEPSRSWQPACNICGLPVFWCAVAS